MAADAGLVVHNADYVVTMDDDRRILRNGSVVIRGTTCLLAVTFAFGCGGGSDGGTTNPPPPPPVTNGFTISAGSTTSSVVPSY